LVVGRTIPDWQTRGRQRDERKVWHSVSMG
jgi:hypothetical protein